MIKHPFRPHGTHTVGMFRFHACTKSAEKQHYDNGRFVFKGRYVLDNRVAFRFIAQDEILYPSNIYRTYYGYGVAHSGHILDKNEANTSEALGRLTALREIETLPVDMPHADKYVAMRVTEEKYRCSQEEFVHQHSEDIAKLIWKHAPETPNDHDCTLEGLVRELLNIKHKKQNLRKEGYKTIHAEGNAYLENWCTRAEAKMKPDEFAKAKKFGRMIIDLGVAASLQGGMYSAYAKHMLGRELVHNGNLYVFLAEATDELIADYLLMMYKGDPRYRDIFLVFSDDACYAIRRGEHTLLGNLDIATCDASHTPALLDMCLRILKFPPEVARALRLQMMSPLNVFSRKQKGQKQQKVVLEPTQMHLPSGITITTLVNCIAMLCIFWSVIHSDIHEEADIIRAAAQVGYKLTLESVRAPQDYQFLKRSLTKDSAGDYHVTLNLGVIFRASGVCRGDLPGRGCHMRRAREFQRALMTGLLKGISNNELNCLKPAAKDIHINPDHYSFCTTHVAASSARSYSLYELTRRYRLTDHEVSTLEHGFLKSGFGQITHCPVVEKILRLDYGLELPA